MTLTVIEIKSAKPKEKPYKIADEKGLYLLINPNGSKLWKFKPTFPRSPKKFHKFGKQIYQIGQLFYTSIHRDS